VRSGRCSRTAAIAREAKLSLQECGRPWQDIPRVTQGTRFTPPTAAHESGQRPYTGGRQVGGSIGTRGAATPGPGAGPAGRRDRAGIMRDHGFPSFRAHAQDPWFLALQGTMEMAQYRRRINQRLACCARRADISITALSSRMDVTDTPCSVRIALAGCWIHELRGMRSHSAPPVRVASTRCPYIEAAQPRARAERAVCAGSQPCKPRPSGFTLDAKGPQPVPLGAGTLASPEDHGAITLGHGHTLGWRANDFQPWLLDSIRLAPPGAA